MPQTMERLYYKDLPDEVFVLAVAHAKRRPDYWQRKNGK